MEKNAGLHASISGEYHLMDVARSTDAAKTSRLDASTRCDAGSRMSTCGGETVGAADGTGVA